MPEATAQSCADAFLRHFIPTFGLPQYASSSDNRNTFISKLGQALHAKLGIVVSYSPLYHPASLGACEREHKEIKHGLKAALVEMGQQHQSRWIDILPWVILGRHTVYQPALGASAAESVLGECPPITGVLVTHEP